MTGEEHLSTDYKRSEHSVREIGELPTDLARVLAKLGTLTSSLIKDTPEFLVVHSCSDLCHRDL